MRGNESSSGDWFASLVLAEDSIDLGDVGLDLAAEVKKEAVRWSQDGGDIR